MAPLTCTSPDRMLIFALQPCRRAMASPPSSGCCRKIASVLEIPKLGLSNTDQSKVRRLLALPHGIVVNTGPTGSGKTTTLATMLTALNDTTRKILTIEDPVEYEIHGVNQSQVKPEIGRPSRPLCAPSFDKI